MSACGKEENCTEVRVELGHAAHQGQEPITEVDLEALYPDLDWADRLRSAVRDFPVFMLSKSTCPFCIESKKVFHSFGVPIHVVEADKYEHGDHVRREAIALTSIRTVPNIWINGHNVGGCNDLKTLEVKGELQRMLRGLSTIEDLGSGEGAVGHGHRGAPKPLFWFPETVNNYVIRLVGFFTVILGTLSVVYYDEHWTHWLLVAMTVDFVVRSTYGGSFSPLSVIAQIMVSYWEPKFSPGAPKQFAGFVGVAFTAVSTLLHFLGYSVAAAVLMGILVIFAAMEAFLGFCFGCTVFGLLIKIGLISPNVYTLHLNTRDDVIYLWHEQFDRPLTTKPTLHGYDDESKIGYKYKVKTDEYVIQDFNVIRHLHGRFFMVPMGISALALAWKGASRESTLDVSDVIWKRIGYVGACVFVAMLALYVVRLFKYPKKVKKEWMHFAQGNGFGAMTKCFLLFAALATPIVDTNVGRVLFWIGAIGHMLLTVVRTSDLIARRVSPSHVNPGWMIFPVGNFLAAVVATEMLDGDYMEMAWIWFGPAVVMWLVLFCTTFYTVVTMDNSCPRMRTLIWIWVAAPSIGSIAYFRLTGSFDAFYRVMVFFALFIFIVEVYCILPNVWFFTSEPFHMMYWVYVFCVNALAMAVMTYDSVMQTQFSYVLAVIMLTVSTLVMFMAVLHTLLGLAGQTIFRPEQKGGPLSFLKMTHEAVRSSLVRVESLTKDIHENGYSQLAGRSLLTELKQLRVVLEEHHTHEDQVVFKQFDAIFPGTCGKYVQQHKQMEESLSALITSAEGLAECSASKTDDFFAAVMSFSEAARDNMLAEDDHLYPIGRKYLNLDLNKALVRKAYEMTPAARWRIIMPWVINHLPILMQRKRYLKAFMWGMQEQCQIIGRFVYEGVDNVQWRLLTRALPEIIPRAADGWYRYH